MKGILLPFLLLSGVASAHTCQPVYWVVESVRQPDPVSIVRFYSASDQVIYEEIIPGTLLDVSSPRVQRHLSRTAKRLSRYPQETGNLLACLR
jgi:hypothetical protein